MIELIGTVFSPCRTWRYTLERNVFEDNDPLTCTFIGLNPSTADETKDDPTIRRCIGYSAQWGYAKLVMLNMYAFRATDPRKMRQAEDRVGPENDKYIAEVVSKSELVVCAWGNSFVELDRVDKVLAMIEEPHCLGITLDGQPRHPLYMRKGIEPMRFFVP